MNIRDAIHDRIDAREQLAEDARAAVKKVIIERLDEVLESVDSFDDVFEELAAIVEEEHMADLTTSAVHKGVEMARKRMKAKGSV